MTKIDLTTDWQLITSSIALIETVVEGGNDRYHAWLRIGDNSSTIAFRQFDTDMFTNGSATAIYMKASISPTIKPMFVVVHDA
jgi:hypothetical protein